MFTSHQSLAGLYLIIQLRREQCGVFKQPYSPVRKWHPSSWAHLYNCTYEMLAWRCGNMKFYQPVAGKWLDAWCFASSRSCNFPKYRSAYPKCVPFETGLPARLKNTCSYLYVRLVGFNLAVQIANSFFRCFHVVDLRFPFLERSPFAIPPVIHLLYIFVESVHFVEGLD